MEINIMSLSHTKLRHVTIALQFIAGVGLLTASYLTTETDWTHQLINAATNNFLREWT